MSDSVDKEKENTEKEISLIEIIQKLWSKRRFIIKACIIGGIIGLIIGYSIPKEYVTTVVLAPEKSSGTSGGLGSLAAMAGINLQQNASSEILPDLYPNIVKSTPFLMGLLNLQVVDEKHGINTTLSDYLSEYQKKAWWSYIFGLPGTVLGWFSSSEKGENVIVSDPNEKVIVLTKEQKRILDALKTNINVSVDKKTGAITLAATMQSANISAMMVDTLTGYMQAYIISYRTEKARQDLVFTQKLYDEAQDSYFNAQQKYAEYSDRHQNIISASFRVTQERMQNEMNLAYNVYNQMAQQLQMAKMKVQDETPVYTVIQPAEIPLNAASPKKMTILIGLVFLTLVGVSFWIVSGKDFFSRLKNNS